MKRRCVHVPGLFCFLNSAVPTENLDHKAACFVCLPPWRARRDCSWVCLVAEGSRGGLTGERGCVYAPGLF